MRVVSLTADVLVATSREWQTNCTAIRSGEEGFVIDSPIFPDELEVLPAVLEQAGFPVSGLLATHGDWDHVLGRLAFPGAALGVAETTAAYLTGEPGAAQRELRAWNEEHYVERAPLSLGQVQALPVPGHVRPRRARARAAPDRGPHRRRHGGLGAVGARARLRRLPSPVEIPTLSPTRLARRLPGDAGASAPARRPRPSGWCPATAPPIDGARALAILNEDVRYLTDWELPLTRRTAAQRAVDAENRRRAGEAP